MNIQSCSAAPFLDNTFKKDKMKTMHELESIHWLLKAEVGEHEEIGNHFTIHC